MYTNVNLAAPVGALAFLGTGLLLFVVALALIYSVVRKKFRLGKFVLVTIVLVAGLYLVILLIFSFASNEKVLARAKKNTSAKSIATWLIPSRTCARRRAWAMHLIS